MTVKSKENTVPTSTESQPAANGFSLISNEKLLHLYDTMVKCRMMEERIRILFKQKHFDGNGYSGLGQEAAAVGVAIDLLPEDTVAGSHGDFLTRFIQGVPLGNVMKSLYSGFASSSKFRSASAPLNTVTAAALANKTKRNKKIAVAFSSSASDSLDSWHAALNLAGHRELPILFICRNGLRAETASLRPTTKLPRGMVKETAVKAQRYGFPSIAVDGNDVVAVYRVASESIARARQGRGPTLIECKRWQADDPILNMEKYLTGKGLFTRALKRQIAGGFSRELDSAIEAVEK